MSLNIKNEETHRLVRELAELTGESMTTAVTEAVRQRLKRVRGQGDSDRRARLRAILDDCASRFREPWKSIDHGDFLYDERGLPK